VQSLFSEREGQRRKRYNGIHKQLEESEKIFFTTRSLRSLELRNLEKDPGDLFQAEQELTEKNESLSDLCVLCALCG